jgi:hypothetical protein
MSRLRCGVPLRRGGPLLAIGTGVMTGTKMRYGKRRPFEGVFFVVQERVLSESSDAGLWKQAYPILTEQAAFKSWLT